MKLWTDWEATWIREWYFVHLHQIPHNWYTGQNKENSSPCWKNSGQQDGVDPYTYACENDFFRNFLEYDKEPFKGIHVLGNTGCIGDSGYHRKCQDKYGNENDIIFIYSGINTP